jgi:uncharacterized protein YaaQ
MTAMAWPKKSRGEREDRLLEWLLTPKERRDPPTQEKLAAELGTTPGELSKLKHSAEFLALWNTTYLRTIGSPDAKMSIMETLLRTATDQDDPKHVQAAKAYFEIEGSLRPAKVEVKVQAGAVSQLSDDDLQRLLAAKANDELAKRRDAS